jgi:parallel beta-helix repeat protein
LRLFRVTCFFAVLAAVPLFAQSTISAQLSVSGPGAANMTHVPIGTEVDYHAFFSSDLPVTTAVQVELDIPGTITNVTSNAACSGTRPIRCTLAPATFFSESVVVRTRLDTPGVQTAAVRVQGREVTRTLEVVNRPSVTVFAIALNLAGRRADPGQLVQYETSVSTSAAAVPNVRVRYTLPSGGSFIAVRPSDPLMQCSVAEQEILCTTALLSGHVSVDIDARAPLQLTGGTFVLRAEATHEEPDFNPADDVAEVLGRVVRGLTVTTTSDEGSGSLRQALLDAQTLCADEPCAVVFRIPGTAPDGVFAIRPKSALPEVRGWVKIDGATQEGARIALIGTEAGLAHGLLVGESCEVQVLNLSISGFAWPGIEVQRTFRGRFCNPADRSINTPILIAGNELRGNYRGIVLVESDNAEIRDNVIEHNVRAGIFADRAFLVLVHDNRVAENGASGMFFNVGSRDTAGGAHVHDNVIVNNAEWGITRTNRGWVAIQRNAIFGNAHPAIDLNLDFETPNRADDDFTSIPNKPVLLSAFYDPVQDETFVVGRLDTNNWGGGVELDFYVDNHPTRRHMGAWAASFDLSPDEVNREFRLAIPKNLKGSYLVATNTRSRFIGLAKPPDVASDGHSTGLLTDTSEVSNAVLVQ